MAPIAIRPSGRKLVAVGLVFSLSLLFFLLTMYRIVAPYDEGLITDRHDAGCCWRRTPPDFYANYRPAQFYVLAEFFKIFGQSIIVEQISVDLLVRSITVVLCYIIMIAYCRYAIALVATITCAIWLSGFPIVGNYGYPVFPALLFTMVGAFLIHAALLERKREPLRAIIPGVTTGLVALFRYDVGFFSFMRAILFCHNIEHHPGRRPAKRRTRIIGDDVILGDRHCRHISTRRCVIYFCISHQSVSA